MATLAAVFHYYFVCVYVLPINSLVYRAGYKYADNWVQFFSYFKNATLAALRHCCQFGNLSDQAERSAPSLTNILRLCP